MPIYKFRNCLLNTEERCVVKGDQYVDLTTKTFDVLLYLIENAGKIISKDELLGAVWGGNFVEESNLPVHISKIRRCLSESKRERYVETIQGVGYRFVAPTESVESQEWRVFLKSVIRARRLRFDRRYDSVAILPFENENGSDDLSYLTDGFTEGFINKLSLLPGLKVIARNTVFRYKGKRINPIDIGEVLGVSALLLGRVRLVSNQLTVSVELVSVSDGTQLWGEVFHEPFEKIVSIRERILLGVTEKLRGQEINHQAVTEFSGSRNPQSYKAFLKGDYLLAKRTIDAIYKAIEWFNSAISYDSSNIQARVKSIDCYRLLYILDAIPYNSALERISRLMAGISFEQEIDTLQLMLGLVSAHMHWNFEDAEKFIARAVALNPNSVDANSRYAEVLFMIGRPDQALLQIPKLLELDPFSVPTYKTVARLYYWLDQPEEALTYLEDALDFEPNDYEALALRGGVLTELGEYDDALLEFKKSIKAHPTVDIWSMIGYVEGLRGDKLTARKIIHQIKEDAQTKYPLKLARIHLALGEREEMYRLLDDAFQHREIELFGLMFDPRWKTIRGESRFTNLANRVGLLSKRTTRPL